MRVPIPPPARAASASVASSEKQNRRAADGYRRPPLPRRPTSRARPRRVTTTRPAPIRARTAARCRTRRRRTGSTRRRRSHPATRVTTRRRRAGPLFRTRAETSPVTRARTPNEYAPWAVCPSSAETVRQRSSYTPRPRRPTGLSTSRVVPSGVTVARMARPPDVVSVYVLSGRFNGSLNVATIAAGAAPSPAPGGGLDEISSACAEATAGRTSRPISASTKARSADTSLNGQCSVHSGGAMARHAAIERVRAGL